MASNTFMSGARLHHNGPYAELGRGSSRVFFFSIAGTEGSILWRYGASRPAGLRMIESAMRHLL